MDIDDPDNTHCCAGMRWAVDTDDLPVLYVPIFREYGIRYSDDGHSMQVLLHCPWCGTELPASLRHQWFDELDSLGIDPIGDVPIAYRSDTWWRRKHSC